MFFSTLRRAIRERRLAEADRDFWKQRSLLAEAKLDDRSDFFIEREFRLIDRFLTSTAKVQAITDEIRYKQPTEQEVTDHALEAYLADKRDALIDYAREAGRENPEETAQRTYDENYSKYVTDFHAQIQH